MARILVIHGPNLNMLGQREPGIYGQDTLADIDNRLERIAGEHQESIRCVQSNSESELIGEIHSARGGGTEFVLINPAAFTHTSVALRDALAASDLPFVEVHISNVHSREPFRHKSYFSDLAEGVICGLGPRGYEYALNYALDTLNNAAR
ncbi:MAG: type II 3-dehydroquinate dehydratase [Pseudomonadota bacterium]